MHFGEYLVQRRVLSAHQILKALAEQNRRRKFVPLLLADQGAMPDYRVLSLWSQADDRHEDFLEVLMAEKFVSLEQSKMIRRSWMRSGPPLGRLLIELGCIDGKKCVDLLKAFEILKAEEELKQQVDIPIPRINLPQS